MKQVGRLAMRQEGDRWVAYYALPNTMDDAIFLGAIALKAVDGEPARREAFLDLMRDLVADIIEDATGVRPTWGGEEPAPAHERAGHS